MKLVSVRRLALLVSLFVLSAPAALAQQCNIIFVTPNGATSGAPGTVGTRDNPADINLAAQLMTPAIRQVNIAGGTYDLDTVFSLVDSVSFEGGFDPGNEWAKTNTLPTIIFRDSTNIQPNPNRIVGLEAVNVDDWRIQDVQLFVEEAPAQFDTATYGRNGVSTYGLYINNASNYSVVRSSFQAGNASDGFPGLDGPDGTNGADGQIGQKGDEDGSCCRGGGSGASSWSAGFCGGCAEGGAGGQGGARASCNFFGSNDAFPGDPGLIGTGSDAGAGGIGGVGNSSFANAGGCANSGAMDGNLGEDGNLNNQAANGPAGAPGTPAQTSGFFQPGLGQNGQPGEHGSGGGGGGGGGSAAICISGLSFTEESSGAGGGGGGEGGQGGFPGRGGGGGGGSFGIYVWNSGPGGRFVDEQATAGLPGQGGAGGDGGSGGSGGNGGPGGATGAMGQPTACNMGAGGDGGDGGDGGNGGDGGDGLAGFSEDFFISPSSQPIDTADFRATNEPQITVRNTGCTQTDVQFNVTASGSIIWFFGNGATPVSATGPEATVQYDSLGRKTITVLINGQSFTFSDYIGLNNDGTGTKPSIQASADTICAGTTPNFQSDITALKYFWDFDGAIPAITDSSLQSVSGIPFNQPGTYEVVLRTESACCGLSDPDTLPIYVRPNPPASVQLAVADTARGPVLCNDGQDDLSFVSATDNAGPNPFYLWEVNGSLADSGFGKPTFTTQSLSDGDQVRVGIVSTRPCLSSDTIYSAPISVTVFPPPQVAGAPNNCIDITALDGEFAPNKQIQLAADAAGSNAGKQFRWDLGNGTGAVGDTVTVLYPQAGDFEVSITLEDSNGCVSQPCTDSIFINFSAEAAFSADTLTGCAPFPVNFQNLSTNAVSFLWDFGDNSTPSTATAPTHTYQSPGTYDVMLRAFGGFNSDTDTVVKQIIVHDTPQADFIGFPNVVTSGDDTVQFSSTSTGASSWQWDFGDPASGPLNTSTLPDPEHFYAAEGRYTVSLIVANNFGCTDTITKTDFIKKDTTVTGRADLASRVDNSLRLFPNPTTGRLRLELELPAAASLDAELAELTGKVVATRRWARRPAGAQQLAWALPAKLADGAYLLRLHVDGHELHRKLILRR